MAEDPISEWIGGQIEGAYETARAYLADHPDESGVKVDMVTKMPDGEEVTVTTLAISREDVGL